MLATLATLMILTAAAFAVIAMAGTLVGHWQLVVAALRYQSADAPAGRPAARAGGRREIKVSVRAPVRPMRVAA